MLKRDTILNPLTKNQLRRLASNLDIDVASRATRQDIETKLKKTRKCTTQDILQVLRVDDLRKISRSVGIDKPGRMKNALIESLSRTTAKPASRQSIAKGRGVSTPRRTRGLNPLTSLQALRQELESDGIQKLLKEYGRASKNAALKEIYEALQLSEHHLARDVSLLGSQLQGRLLNSQSKSAAKLLKSIPRASPSLHCYSASLPGPGGNLLRTMTPDGNRGSVSALAVTANGKQVIACHRDGISIIDIQTGDVVQNLSGSRGAGEAVVLMPDGKAVAAGVENGIKIWDLASGECVWEVGGVPEKRGWIGAIAVTPDGTKLVSALPIVDKIRVWNLSTKKCVRTIEVDQPWDVGVSPDGKKIVSAEGDQVVIWSLRTGKRLRTLSGHRSAVRHLAVTSTDRIVSASLDSTLKVWNLRTGRCLHTLAGHLKEVVSVAVDGAGKRVASGSNDATIIVWDMESGRPIACEPHGNRPEALAYTPNGKHICSSAMLDETIRVWSLNRGSRESTQRAHSDRITDVAVSPDGRKAVTASCDATLTVWNTRTARPTHILRGHLTHINAVAITSDSRFAVSWGRYESYVWDLRTGRNLQRLQDRSELSHNMGHALAIAADTKIVYSCDKSKLSAWDLSTGEKLRSLDFESSVEAVAVTSNGKRIVAGSSDGELKLWGGRTTKSLTAADGPDYSIDDLAITSDDRFVVAACTSKTSRRRRNDGSLPKVWDLRSGKHVRTLERWPWEAKHLKVTRNRKFVVGASWNGKVGVWNFKSGKLLFSAGSDGGWLTGLLTTTDSRFAITIGRDEPLTAWDLQSGEPVVRFAADYALYSGAWINDRALVVGDESGSLHFLRLYLN